LTAINEVRKMNFATNAISLHSASLTESCIMPTTFRS
jgi:hypothetical protein